MNAKRILPWEDDDWNWSVETQCGDLHVVQDDESGEWNAKWVYPDCDDSLGWFPDAESGMDACESAYISRCTEFLTLYNPATHVCVSRETAKTALVMLSGSGDVLSFDRDDAETELRAALEGK